MVFVLWKQPQILSSSLHFVGAVSNLTDFNLYYFGAACTLIFSFVIQIGEQADYLRFLPQKEKNRTAWRFAVFRWSILDYFWIFKSFDGDAADGVGFSAVYSCL